ncbi:hypothetical protein M514_00070 [Trichuris suis]|uniref:Uncharacterized protein n=1 Tax=Trichuris suis TaxID=68888 RepID=A0A085NTY8_9BILA|nr:hypothetical protein M513_00070 [Trichuris suis]KFD72934.1 hypothetical protein M514_00070 [Trichuris suis]
MSHSSRLLLMNCDETLWLAKKPTRLQNSVCYMIRIIIELRNGLNLHLHMEKYPKQRATKMVCGTYQYTARAEPQ